MIAILNGDMGSIRGSEYSPVARLRRHLRLDGAVPSAGIRRDLQLIAQRLACLRRRGGAFARVEMSAVVADAYRSLAADAGERVSSTAER